MCSSFLFNLEHFTPDGFFYMGTPRGAYDTYEVCVRTVLILSNSFDSIEAAWTVLKLSGQLKAILTVQSGSYLQ